jgi:hypothetical protein
MASSVFGIDDRIEKEGDEISKVVRVKMGKQDVRDPVPIHTGPDEVHQGAGATIEEDVLVRAHQIAGRGTRGMHIGPRAKNGESHRQHTGSSQRETSVKPSVSFRLPSLTAPPSRSYDLRPMVDHRDQGQANLTLLAVLLGLIVTGVWVWKRLSVETQDYIVDQALPMAAIGLTITALLFIPIRAVLRHRAKSQARAKLLTVFERETVQDKKLELAFALLEMNEYRVEGLESSVLALKELFITTLQRALGDKQHRIRGMAASHLGALQDLSVVPLLVKALEDDHGTGLGSNGTKSSEGSAGTDAGVTATFSWSSHLTAVH